MSSTDRVFASSREELEARQGEQLKALVGQLLESNPFWAPRLQAAGLAEGPVDAERLRALPTVRKAELVEDQEQNPPYGTNLTFPLESYIRFHQTSGTTGKPMRWLDTADSWKVLLSTWRRVLEAAGIGPQDRLFVPFSFGPFLGFWAAFDAAAELGCLTIPGGGMDSRGRLRVLLENGATAFCATPTYALHLAEVAAAEGIDLSESAVERIIVAGEPGGSVPAVRKRLENLWPGARIFDHHGMTEVGPISFPHPEEPDLLFIDEDAFLAEILEPGGEALMPAGQPGELVITTLRRTGSPLLRYRTGDLVRRSTRSPDELGFVEMALEGGILARVDDMMVVRGVNLYPSAVDQVVRGVGGVAEYRVDLERSGALLEVEVTVEPLPGEGDLAAFAGRLEDAFRSAFQMRIPVVAVEPGTLPRFELKAKRWHRRANPKGVS